MLIKIYTLLSNMKYLQETGSDDKLLLIQQIGLCYLWYNLFFLYLCLQQILLFVSPTNKLLLNFHLIAIYKIYVFSSISKWHENNLL